MSPVKIDTRQRRRRRTATTVSCFDIFFYLHAKETMPLDCFYEILNYNMISSDF
uniref:Uncharacterized protein n=1 Tax=Papilio xuthus TaxID=66420 RepID=I4DQP3_PAPXU|nr:unknown unsecreted protein [Papilio xuthus]